MIEENKKVRYAEEKPKSCEKCYWWDSKEKNCVLGEEKCYYILPDKPMVPKSPCYGCPYGRNNPCVGFCMKKLLGQKS